jgi:hypothetical protein
MIDVLLATLALVVHDVVRDWPLHRQVFLWSIVTPFLIFISYPGCFICGGLMAALLPSVWRAGRAGEWLQYGLWAVVAGLSFLALYLGPVRAQNDPMLRHCWSDVFPDYSRPWAIPLQAGWETLGVVQYAIPPIGEFVGVLGLMAAWWMWREGQIGRLALIVVPPGLAMLAWLMHAYPYGRQRVMAFAAPGVILLVAAGCQQTLAWLRPRGRRLAAIFALCLLLPLANTARHLIRPWVRTDASGACAWVLDRLQPGEAVYGNNWEFAYYFRRAPAACPYHGEPERPADVECPLWVLIGGSDEVGRRAQLDELSQGRQILERREFRLISAVKLAPRAADGAAKGISSRRAWPPAGPSGS